MQKQSSGTAVEEMNMWKATGETSAPTMRNKAILIFQKYQSALLKLTTVLLIFAYCFVSWTSLEDASVDESFLHIIRGVRDMVVVEEDVTVKEFNISCTEKSIDGSEDVLCMKPPTFLKEYKNPCWYTETNEFRCIPYFHLIGSGKCASSDYFDRIIKHPDALGNNGVRDKETFWYSWRRYGIRANTLKHTRKQTLEDFCRYFKESAAVIQQDPQREYITGEGSAIDLSDNCGWQNIPQNNGLKEPKFTTANLMKHLNPDTKLLVILRDPVERLYSDYYFRGAGNLTKEGFHEDVVTAINLLYNCTREKSLRACLYDRYMHYILPVRMHMGFYYVFLQEWFQVFPREQFLIFRTEDYSKDLPHYLQKAFKFLGLRDIPDVMRIIVSQERKFVTSSKVEAEGMKPETRKILQELYGKFNEELARLLNDDRYTWEYTYTK